jgi:hypothetical protein
MEFHEPTGEGALRSAEPRPPTYECQACGLEFSSESDLRLHAFEGHRAPRPVLLFKGRECGKSRLTVTQPVSPDDWVIQEAQAVSVNGRASSTTEAVDYLSSQVRGVTDLTLANGDVIRSFQFGFSLAVEDDLEGVDAALQHLIAGGELSLRTIDDFIMRSKRFPSADRYLSGISNYLYGVLAREGASESALDGQAHGPGYEAKYDQAVETLGTFDRPPAEAICGIVAFHYNQFERAMTKTKSQRVADVSLRIQAILKGEQWIPGDLSAATHSSLDVALSDAVIDQVLNWCALPLDGTADIAELAAHLHTQRPYDAFKLRIVVAEHSLAAGDMTAAIQYAEPLRHGRVSEGWYADFRRRVRGAAPK